MYSKGTCSSGTLSGCCDNGDENSWGSDMRVKVMNCCIFTTQDLATFYVLNILETGKILSGEDAPMASQLDASFLQVNVKSKPVTCKNESGNYHSRLTSQVIDPNATKSH